MSKKGSSRLVTCIGTAQCLQITCGSDMVALSLPLDVILLGAHGMTISIIVRTEF